MWSLACICLCRLLHSIVEERVGEVDRAGDRRLGVVQDVLREHRRFRGVADVDVDPLQVRVYLYAK